MGEAATRHSRYPKVEEVEFTIDGIAMAQASQAAVAARPVSHSALSRNATT